MGNRKGLPTPKGREGATGQDPRPHNTTNHNQYRPEHTDQEDCPQDFGDLSAQRLKALDAFQDVLEEFPKPMRPQVAAWIAETALICIARTHGLHLAAEFAYSKADAMAVAGWSK